MENANTNYIMVSADDISRDLYIFYRDLIFGGWFESYSISDRISASDTFSKFNIPEDYQKIIISINKKLFRSKAKEFITDFKFDTSHMFRNGEEKYLTVEKNVEKYDEKVLFNRIKLITPLNNIIDQEQVVSFYRTLDSNGYLKQYIEAVYNFFINISYQLGSPKKFDSDEKHYTLLKKKIDI